MTEYAHNLLLPFDADEPEFVRGFEAGRVWANLRIIQAEEWESPAPDGTVRFTVHWSNAEMMLRIGEALGFQCRAERLDDLFCDAVFQITEAFGG